MNRVGKMLCVLLFSLLCAALLLFLYTFTVADSDVIYLEWERAAVVSPEGAETPFDPLGEAPALDAGARYRFAAGLPARESPQWLIFEVTGAELAVWVNGKELYRSSAFSPDETAVPGQIQLSLPPGGAAELVMDLRPIGAGPGIFPPLPRLTADPLDYDGTIAYANSLALPAGAAALALVLVWGLFLLGAALNRPDWSLLPLSLAALGLTAYRLSQGVGGYFLPPWLQQALSWQGVGLLTALALLLYLLLNRRRRFYRSFGLALLISAGALLLAALLSLPLGGGLVRYLAGLVRSLFLYGFYDGLVHWLTLWLTAVCALLSGEALVRSIVDSRSQAHAAKVQYQLTLENYQQAAAKNRQTAALRHEWKNQVTALRLLAQRGDLPALERRLEQLEGDLGRLSAKDFTDQPAINAILQNAAYRAEALGVDFQVQALLPGNLQLDEGDLCALLLNLLDNAVEAAAQVPPPRPREVRCRLKLTQGFLAVSCENTYSGPLRTDLQGRLLTSKADPESHGFGLDQMRAVTAKYHGMLTLSHDGERFTVEAALKVPGAAAGQ